MKSKGFTLIELLVAIAIFCVLGIALLSMFSQGNITVFSNGSRTKAVSKAQSVMDAAINEINSVNVGSITKEQLRTAILQSANKYRDNHNSSDASYKCSYTLSDMHKDGSDISEVQGTQTTDYYKLTIIMSYHSGTKQISITSLINAGG